MIVTAFNPETEGLERTYLSEYSEESSTSLTVKNTNNFDTDQAVLVGAMGSERAEIITTDGVTHPDIISIDGTTNFAHNADDPVYLMRYNKVQFWRSSTVNGTYSLVATVDIDVDNADKLTRYDDSGGSATDYYKIKYSNSISSDVSEFSDPIRGDGYEALTIGKVIDVVVRRVGDRSYTVLSPDEYLDIAQEVNDDLLTQARKPYKFMKKDVDLDTTAAQAYIDLTADVPDFYKFDFLIYKWTVGGVTHEYQITPISLEAFRRKYDNSNYLDDDQLIDIAIDEEENYILLGPAPKTSQTGKVELHYYATLARIDSLGDEVQTPNTLIYKYKMMAEYYSSKAETDRQWMTLATKYEDKYGNEVVKMQRVNNADAGTPKSFAPKRVPRMRKRYHL